MSERGTNTRQPTFQEYIRLCLDASDHIKKLKKERFNRRKLQHALPSTLRVGMIYLLAKKRGYNITQRQISYITGKQESSVRRGAKILKELLWEG
ncbi:hypothetical protein ES703_88089 [subsurface metagenome]